MSEYGPKPRRNRGVFFFDRNVNGWVRIPKSVKLPKNQQDRDMIARELLVKFQMSPDHPLAQLNKACRKFQ